MIRTKIRFRNLAWRRPWALGLAVLLVAAGATILAGRAKAWTGPTGAGIATAGGMRLQAAVGGALPSRLRHVVRGGAVGDGAHDEGGMPRENDLRPVTRLESIRPNPFNPRTAITYSVALETHVTLTIVAATGARVRRLVDATVGAEAPHTVTWDGRDDNGTPVGSGVYFCQLAAGGEVRTKKVILLK